MNINEVRVKLLGGRSDRLRAFCSITIDDEFVVHDLRVIEGRKGLFVAMPSRKLTGSCPRCAGKNHLRAKFCSECGAKLEERQDVADPKGRDKLHVDVAHPIHPACRELIQSTVLQAYEDEVKRGAEGLEPARAYERAEASGIEDEDDGAEPEEPEVVAEAGQIEVHEPTDVEADKPEEFERDLPSEQEGEVQETDQQEHKPEEPGGFGDGIL